RALVFHSDSLVKALVLAVSNHVAMSFGRVVPIHVWKSVQTPFSQIRAFDFHSLSLVMIDPSEPQRPCHQFLTSWPQRYSGEFSEPSGDHRSSHQAVKS